MVCNPKVKKICNCSLKIKLTHDQRAPQGDWRTAFASLASRQFHRGCVRGTAISQQQTWEYDHDEYDDNDFDHVDESCDSDHIKGV